MRRPATASHEPPGSPGTTSPWPHFATPDIGVSLSSSKVQYLLAATKFATAALPEALTCVWVMSAGLSHLLAVRIPQGLQADAIGSGPNERHAPWFHGPAFRVVLALDADWPGIRAKPTPTHVVMMLRSMKPADQQLVKAQPQFPRVRITRRKRLSNSVPRRGISFSWTPRRLTNRQVLRRQTSVDTEARLFWLCGTRDKHDSLGLQVLHGLLFFEVVLRHLGRCGWMQALLKRKRVPTRCIYTGLACKRCEPHKPQPRETLI